MEKEKVSKKNIIYLSWQHLQVSNGRVYNEVKTNDYYIESAAMSTEEIGNGIYPQAKEQLIKHGITGFKDKRERQVRKSDYDEFDYLIIMDEENRYGLERIVGKDRDNKIYKILDF